LLKIEKWLLMKAISDRNLVEIRKVVIHEGQAKSARNWSSVKKVTNNIRDFKTQNYYRIVVSPKWQ
jgi:hypothetical protein